ncbi:MAG: ion transporter [Pseudomonadota bacterium]
MTTQTLHWRARLAAWLEQRGVQRTIMGLIVLNAVTLGLETSPAAMQAAGPQLLAVDHALLTIFVVEIALRLAAHGWRFFRDPWSVFDFVVIAIALLPAIGPLSVLRALRILRVLRLLSVVPQMRQVVAGLLSAIPGLTSIIGILLLLYYVFAVIATKLFGAAFPDWFGNIGASMYTLFQIMTLEGWAEIARSVMEVFPRAWTFFVVYILVITFTMLNLFIAIIVNAMQSQYAVEQQEAAAAVSSKADEITALMHADMRALHAEVRELREQLRRHEIAEK